MIEKYKHLKIRILKEAYQYVLLKQHSTLEDLNILFLNSKKPVALFISDEEKSFIAPSDLDLHVEIDKIETGWICFKIIGSMPFGTVQGLIAHLSSILMKDNIGVCIVSTFKSDWFFIKSKYMDKSINLLNEEGWIVEQESIS